MENIFLIHYRGHLTWKYVKYFILFLTVFIICFYYSYIIYYDNNGLLLFSHLLVLTGFIITVLKPRAGLYFSIFLIPLLNTVTTIIGVRPITFSLLIFFAFALGFLVNSISSSLSENYNLKSAFIYEQDIGKYMLIFIVLTFISALITVFRFSNFWPFITNNYHNLRISKSGNDSTSSIYWVINYFFTYVSGFSIFFITFNIVKKIRDIITAMIVLAASTFISSAVLFFQYFFKPTLGSFSYWVNSGRYNATFTDPNSLGAYTILLFPVFFSFILYFKKWYSKLAFAFITVILLLMMFLSGSRSAFLGVFISVAFFLVIGVARGINILSDRQKLYRKHHKIIVIILFILLFIIIMIAVVFVLRIVLSDSRVPSGLKLFERLIKTTRTALNFYKKLGLVESLKSISNYRYLYWSQAVRMAYDYPMSGVGLGAYIIELRNYSVLSRTFFTGVDFTGNYYLQILSEQGIPALVVLLIILFFLFKKSLNYLSLKKDMDLKTGPGPGKNISADWVFKGLFISFTTMVLAIIFGPHTNFMEIQLLFFILIGLMLSFLKITDNQTNDYAGNWDIRHKKNLSISSRLVFSIYGKIGLTMILLIFSINFLLASLTTLSIYSRQNLYDFKGEYHGWDNKYGFFNEEVIDGRKARWTESDASETVDNKGQVMVIPVKDGIPDEYFTPLRLQIFIDNLCVKNIKLQNNLWYDLKVNIPDYARDKFVLTLVVSRVWIPKETGIGSDTRQLGILVGEYAFYDKQ